MIGILYFQLLTNNIVLINYPIFNYCYFRNKEI